MTDYGLSSRAIRDIVTAQDWYDRQAHDLGNRFFDAVLLGIRAARENPLRYPEVSPGVRGVICPRFPYRIYYEVCADKVVVRAVYHTARDPSKWDDSHRE